MEASSRSAPPRARSTASSGCSPAWSRGDRWCWRSTTRTGPTGPPCASSATSLGDSTGCRSWSCWRRVRPCRARGRAVRELTAELELPTLRPAPLSEGGPRRGGRRLGDTGRRGGGRRPRGDRRQPVADRGAAGRAQRERRTAPSPALIATMGPGRVAASVAERAGASRPARPRRGPRRRRARRRRRPAGAGGAGRVDRERPRRIVDGLAAASILAAGLGHRFVHPLVRAAVYEGIPPPRRASLHARAATVLRRQGADARGDRRPPAALRAGGGRRGLAMLSGPRRSAAERGAPDSAAAYLRRALESRGPTGRATRLLGGLEVVMREPAASGTCRRPPSLPKIPEKALGIYLELADLVALAGEWEMSLQMIDAGLARCAAGLDVLAGRLDLEAFRAAFRGYDPARVADFDGDAAASAGAGRRTPAGGVAAAALDPRGPRLDPGQLARRDRRARRTPGQEWSLGPRRARGLDRHPGGLRAAAGRSFDPTER